MALPIYHGSPARSGECKVMKKVRPAQKPPTELPGNSGQVRFVNVVSENQVLNLTILSTQFLDEHIRKQIQRPRIGSSFRSALWVFLSLEGGCKAMRATQNASKCQCKPTRVPMRKPSQSTQKISTEKWRKS